MAERKQSENPSSMSNLDIEKAIIALQVENADAEARLESSIAEILSSANFPELLHNLKDH